MISNISSMHLSKVRNSRISHVNENNSGFWNRLEIYCRDLTKKYKGVRIFSGPLNVPTKDEDGSSYVKHSVSIYQY
jgi:DNA/RNA endonuclease G (NUC1)